MEPKAVTLTWATGADLPPFSQLLCDFLRTYLYGGEPGGAEVIRRLDEMAEVLGDARGPF